MGLGLKRDFGQSETLSGIEIQMAYYGDVTNRFLGVDLSSLQKGGTSRRTLEELEAIPPSGFNKSSYSRLPGRMSIRERLADLLSEVLPWIGLTDSLIDLVAPEMREYWNEETEFGSEVRKPLIKPLQAAFKRGDSICILAHSLGTMIAYDTLWKASHLSEWESFHKNKIDLFLTLGSPIGDRTVQSRLKGASIKGSRRFPHSIRKWINVAAVDDYVAHDSTVRNDFQTMLDQCLLQSIVDQRIFNLSLLNGVSDPHNVLGYLIHPAVANTLRAWVTE